jgi:hypothetical protein
MSYYTILRYKPLDFEIAPKSSEVQATFDEARMYCFSLKVDGKVGWRLPTKYELIKIYNKVSHDFEKDWYLSSTVFFDDSIWMVPFHDGITGGSNGADVNMIHGMASRYVRAVRDLKDN